MKIKLTNETLYLHTDIKRIVRHACKLAGVAGNQLSLKVVHSRSKRISGRASVPFKRTALYRGTMLLRIPKPRAYEKLETLIDNVCKVTLHEAMHLAGVRHEHMTREQYRCEMPTPWSSQMQLREKPKATKRTVMSEDRYARKLQHAELMLARAVTRLKRATTLEKNWRSKVKRLQVRLESSAVAAE